VFDVSDLDDARYYPARSKPHSGPLDYRINAFFFLPATLHAVSVRKPLQCPPHLSAAPAGSAAQFDDADI